MGAVCFGCAQLLGFLLSHVACSPCWGEVVSPGKRQSWSTSMWL